VRLSPIPPPPPPHASAPLAPLEAPEVLRSQKRWLESLVLGTAPDGDGRTARKPVKLVAQSPQQQAAMWLEEMVTDDEVSAAAREVAAAEAASAAAEARGRALSSAHYGAPSGSVARVSEAEQAARAVAIGEAE
jgi:hypothetical protein